MQAERSEYEALIIGLWARTAVGSGLLRRLALARSFEVFQRGSEAHAALAGALSERMRGPFQALCTRLDVEAEAAAGHVLEARCRAREVVVRVLGEAGYPQRLAATPDAPAVLTVRGEAGVLGARLVAVVGTRQACQVGLDACKQLVRGLHERGLIVVSGGALGIDACAHRMALSLGAPTVVVSATGIDGVYPRRNQDIYAEAVRRGGAVVSQFPPLTPPRPERFPRRNPTIAGLAIATIVVEAPHGSGALHTAEAAQRHGRAVWVVSGVPFCATTAGGHALIKSGDASLLDSLVELTQLERGRSAAKVSPRAPQRRLPLDAAPAMLPVAARSPVADVPAWRAAVVARLSRGDASRDELLAVLVDRPDAHGLLLGLELDGTLARVAGGRYRLASGAGVVKLGGGS